LAQDSNAFSSPRSAMPTTTSMRMHLAGDELIPRSHAIGMHVSSVVTPLTNNSKKTMKRQRGRLAEVEVVFDEGPRCRRRKTSVCAAVRAPLMLKPALTDLKAIVINLERRPDRMDGCTARMVKHSPELCCERFRATDGKKDSIRLSEVTTSWHTARNVHYQKLRAIRKGWDDLDTYQARQLVMSPGERGCAMSHIRAWRYCLDHAGTMERPLMVLEDDAAPVDDFSKILVRSMNAMPEDSHMLYLGYSQASEWRREVTPDLVESDYVWTTVGYIIWPAGARILLNRLPIDQPVDNWLATLCANHEIKAYCTRPKIIRQVDAWNVNSDVAHSDEHYWGPCSDIRHSDDFYWGASQDKTNKPAADDKRVFCVDDSENSEDDAWDRS